MKYFIVVTFLLLIGSCKGPENPHYALANDAIDSFMKYNSELHDICSRLKKGDDLNPYTTAVLKRFIFARIYQEEVNKLEKGQRKNELIKRFNKEIKRDPYDFFPVADMDSSQKELFCIY